MARGKIFSDSSKKAQEFTQKQENMLKRQAKLRHKNLIEHYKNGDLTRPKNVCPVCFNIHFEDVPDSCWARGLTKGDVSDQTEFENYLTQNKKGRVS